MRASEWQFLCAVHESPKSCCAIDYCCHTLDWATNIVTSQKIFPSRLSLGDGDGIEGGGPGFKHLINIFRRLHRIFAHAWFQHKGVFWEVEGQTGLYVLFKTVCDNYDLLPAENYKLPPEAEGLEQIVEAKPLQHTILKPESLVSNNIAHIPEPRDEQKFMSVGRTNTRRHIRSSPSTGAAVQTVLEDPDAEGDIGGESEVPLSTPDSEEESEVVTMIKNIDLSDKDTSEEEDLGVAQPVEEEEIQIEAAPDIEVEAEADVPVVVISSQDDFEVEAEPESVVEDLQNVESHSKAPESSADVVEESTPAEEEAAPETPSIPEVPATHKEAVHELEVEQEAPETHELLRRPNSDEA
jgi:hypothetical protein